MARKARRRTGNTFWDYVGAVVVGIPRGIWRGLTTRPWIITGTVDAMTRNHRSVGSKKESAIASYRNAAGQNVPFDQLREVERRYYSSSDRHITGIEIDEYVSNVERSEFDG